MTAPARALRFGANYVPSGNWFHSWLDFDADAVRRDFADLASIGLDHVRVFPLWPLIQPNRSLIRRKPIDDLLTVVDLAAEAGLSVAVDLLQGHLSSFDFLPSWVQTSHHRSLFEDKTVRAGIASYVAEMTRALAGHDNVLAITLGNEVNNLWPHFSATAAATRGFASELLDTVGRHAPRKLRLYSVYDAAWYTADHPFDPADATDLGHLTTVHSWVFNGVSELDGAMGPAGVSHADYLVELAAATATDPKRSVWLQEVGAPAPDVPAALAGRFVADTLWHVSTNPALWGVTWWCSHDVDRSLVDFPEREYDLGLFTVDHRPKPAAEALAACIAASPGPVPERRPGLRCPVDLRAQPERRDEVAPGSSFHSDWVRLRQNGPVAIVPPGRTQDEEYLAARGIRGVISSAH